MSTHTLPQRACDERVDTAVVDAFIGQVVFKRPATIAFYTSVSHAYRYVLWVLDKSLLWPVFCWLVLANQFVRFFFLGCDPTLGKTWRYVSLPLPFSTPSRSMHWSRLGDLVFTNLIFCGTWWFSNILSQVISYSDYSSMTGAVFE